MQTGRSACQESQDSICREYRSTSFSAAITVHLYRRTGTLCEGRYRSSLIDSDTYLERPPESTSVAAEAVAAYNNGNRPSSDIITRFDGNSLTIWMRF